MRCTICQNSIIILHNNIEASQVRFSIPRCIEVDFDAANWWLCPSGFWIIGVVVYVRGMSL
ncbi:hypothetical protein RchiOBHm_Chr1g0316041 [Rosa chinensis]|uniref:Uncharacterized protein n=1 Tax=Rosa chinensis TaxID=74649 RepID=A0A2P6S7I3_ROSCH|nr:hypothetical protein RchiOBHm_Chr1g0316041 [Rosa chinensis]